MVRMNVKFIDGTMVIVDDNGIIRRDAHDQPSHVDLSVKIADEIHPDPETVYTISMKRVGSAMDIHIDDASPITYRQLELYIRRLYRKSKMDQLKTVFDGLLSSPDMPSFERQLRKTDIDDQTFNTIKEYLLTVMSYYRSGGTDIHFLNVKNLGEMITIIPTLKDVTFTESFFNATSSRDKRTPMMVSIIIDSYKEIRDMDDEKLRGYIASHPGDIRSRVATFLLDRRLKDSHDRTHR